MSQTQHIAPFGSGRQSVRTQFEDREEPPSLGLGLSVADGCNVLGRHGQEMVEYRHVTDTVAPAVPERPMDALIAIAARPINGQEVQTVNARDLHAFLEIRKDFSDWVKDQLDVFAQDIDFAIFPPKGENNGIPGTGETRGRPRTDYALTIECAKHIAMMSRTEKGRQARDYFIECERRAKAAAPFAIPQTMSEALRLAADLNDQKNAAIARAEEAERTKAWIGSKREATAMAKASAETRRANALEIKLDKSLDYATIKRMNMLYPGQQFSHHKLIDLSNRMQLYPEKVPDSNYATVNAYHTDVWMKLYGLPIADKANGTSPNRVICRIKRTEEIQYEMFP